MFLILSEPHVGSVSLSEKDSESYYLKCAYVFTENTRHSWLILTKLSFPRRIFGKSSNVKFHENPGIMRTVVSCGQTDTLTDRQT